MDCWRKNDDYTNLYHEHTNHVRNVRTDHNVIYPINFRTMKFNVKIFSELEKIMNTYDVIMYMVYRESKYITQI